MTHFEDYDEDELPRDFDEGGEEHYYFDLHPTEEDLMGKTYAQSECRWELIDVLQNLYRAEDWFIAGNFGIFKTDNVKEYPAEPDIAVFKGTTKSAVHEMNLRSWKMVLPNRPPPQVVFEISQWHNWRTDLYQKPKHYQWIGVTECFVFNPHHRVIIGDTVQLAGWRYQDEQMLELQPNDEGWLWSVELESWLVPDGIHLRLYDRNGQKRLTRVEDLQAQTEAYQNKTIEHERQRLIAEARNIAQTDQLNQALREKLINMGIDPDHL